MSLSQVERLPRLEGPNLMNADDTMKRTSDGAPHDWTRFDAMSEADRHAAALADPDARPLSAADLRHMRRTPQVRVLRRALGLSPEDFAARFNIPLDTLHDWEQGRTVPDPVARAYLTVIGRIPGAVNDILHPGDEPR